jgi:hypothetical protein
MTEVLPTLQSIFIEGLQPSSHVPEGFGWSLPRDSSPVILLPFPSGKVRGRTAMIDRPSFYLIDVQCRLPTVIHTFYIHFHS